MLDINFYKNYPDLSHLCNNELKFHWEQKGKLENRFSNLNDFYHVYPNFNWGFYLDTYPDLKKSGILTEEQAALHYHIYGIKKKEKIFSFNELDVNISNIKKLFSSYYDDSLLIYQNFIEEDLQLVFKFLDIEHKIIVNSMKDLISYIDNMLIHASENKINCIDYIIIIPVWKRREILEKTLKSLDKKTNIILIVSTLDDYTFAKNNNYNFLLSSNYPLGRKLNNSIYFIEYVQKIKYKYLMFLDSDNVVSDNYICECLKQLKCTCSDIIGSEQQILINGDQILYRKFYNHFNKTFGSGRIYSRNAIRKLNYKLCDDNLSKGIDKNITKRINKRKIVMNIIDIPIVSFYDKDNNITSIEEMNQETRRRKYKNCHEEFKTNIIYTYNI